MLDFFMLGQIDQSGIVQICDKVIDQRFDFDITTDQRSSIHGKFWY